MPGKHAWIAAILLAFPAGFGGAQTIDKKRIALYDFDYSTVKERIAKDISPSYNIGRNVSSMLLSPLTGSGAYDVIDRARIQAIFAEQNMKFSDRFDPTRAAAYGKILGVDAIVTGTVDNVFVEFRQTTQGLMGIGRKKTQVRALVEITAQVISTETAQIFLAPTASAEVTETIGSEMGTAGGVPANRRGGAVGGPGGSGTTSSSNNPGEPAVRKAVRKCVEKLAEEMIAKAPTLPRRASGPAVTRTTTPTPSPVRDVSKAGGGVATKSVAAPKAGGVVRAAIIDVSGNAVFVDKGSKAGVKVGDRFDVRRFVRSVTGSDGKALKLDKKVGVVEITEVSEDWSTGNYSGEAAQKGDTAVRVQ